MANQSYNKTTKSLLFNSERYILPAILILTIIVFANTLANDFIVSWDDQGYVIDNPVIRHLNWESIKEMFSSYYIGNYHPITMLSYAFDFSLWGLNPFYFHLTNLLLHLANVALVYVFIKKLSAKVTIAAITSCFFAIHPMHIESVAWIAERKDVLFTFFFLLALISYCIYVFEKQQTKYLVFTFFLFLLSILSKPAALCLPLLLVLIDYYKTKRLELKVLLQKIPFFVLAFIFGIIAIKAQQSFNAITTISEYINGFNRVFLISYSTVYYVFQAIFPFNLSVIHYYPYVTQQLLLPYEYYLSFIAVIAIILLVLKTKQTKHELVFGLLFYIITIIMVLQILPVGRTIVSERYSYTPYIGLFYIVGFYFNEIIEKNFNKNILSQNLLLFIIIGTVLIFSVITFNRNKHWKNAVTLFTDVVEREPYRYYAWFLRGNAKMKMNDFEGAKSDYDHAIQFYKTNAELYLNRGFVETSLAKYDEALPDYNMAIKLDSTKYKYWFNRGTLFLLRTEYEKAITDYTKAIQQNKYYILAYCNRGAAYAYLNQMDKSLLDFNKAIEILPNYAEAYFSRGFTKLSLQDSVGACADWEKAKVLGFANADDALIRNCK